jgi:ketosteroid isomerase-like protein
MSIRRFAGLATVVMGIAFGDTGSVLTSRSEAGQQGTAVEQELVKLEREFGDAFLKQDAALYDRIEAADFAGIDALGGVYTKAQDIAGTKNGEWKVQSFQLSDMKVRIYGDTAVVMGQFSQKAQYKGADRSYMGRFTDTWFRRDGRWQVVASQATRNAKQ